MDDMELVEYVVQRLIIFERPVRQRHADAQQDVPLERHDVQCHERLDSEPDADVSCVRYTQALTSVAFCALLYSRTVASEKDRRQKCCCLKSGSVPRRVLL